MALLEIKGVSKQFFADGKEMVALQDINLDIEENEFVCFIGPSGCGKTTLLRIMAGLEEATNGRYSMENHKRPRPETWSSRSTRYSRGERSSITSSSAWN
jgi:NitT/TauT family transport system ATP-binding protein